MQFNKELLKGSISTLLLSLLAEKPMYGYDIAKKVNERTNGLFELREGTLYSALHKLEKDGLVEGKWETLPNGRERKYYHLTEKGKRAVADARAEWRRFTWAINMVLGEAQMEKVAVYLQTVCSKLGADEHEKQAIAKELTSHIEQDVEALMADGKSEAESVDLALKRLGDPQTVGKSLMGTYGQDFLHRTLLPAVGAVLSLVLLGFSIHAVLRFINANVWEAKTGIPWRGDLVIIWTRLDPEHVVYMWQPDLKPNDVTYGWAYIKPEKSIFLAERTGGVLHYMKNNEQRLALQALLKQKILESLKAGQSEASTDERGLPPDRGSTESFLLWDTYKSLQGIFLLVFLGVPLCAVLSWLHCFRGRGKWYERMLVGVIPVFGFSAAMAFFPAASALYPPHQFYSSLLAELPHRLGWTFSSLGWVLLVCVLFCLLVVGIAEGVAYIKRLRWLAFSRFAS